jgi:hypothetical protein
MKITVDRLSNWDGIERTDDEDIYCLLKDANEAVLAKRKATKDKIIEMLKVYFMDNRFDKNHHLGLGDIRLTKGQQEDIISKIEEEMK